jgi:hypothetical protein
MTVDLRSVPTQVIIQGATNLDVSQAFISLSISGNALDDSGWFKPRGQIVLGQLPGFAESFDCRANPGRWAPGTIVAVSVWLGGVWVPLPWRLRILTYPNRPMPGNRTITLEVGTDADLLNYRAPEGDPGNDEYGTPTGATFLINRALSQAGAPSLADSITTLNLPFSPEKNTGGSWMTYAGTVAYASRHILWQQSDGAIRATPLTLDGLTPTATYTVGTDEADYVLSPPGEQPPEIVQVQGTTYRIADATPQDSVVEETINGVLTRTEVRYEDWDTSEPKIIETISIPLNLIAPPKFADNTGLSVLRRTTTTRTYDNWDRHTETLVKVEEPWFTVRDDITNNLSMGVFSEVKTTNTFPLSFVSVDGGPALESIVRGIKATEIILKRTTVERSLVPSPWRLVDRLVTVERWEKKTAEQYLYSRSIQDNSPDKIGLPALPNEATFSPPPATQFKPAEKQRTEVAYSGRATFTNAVGSSFAEKLWNITLPSGMGVSNDQCRAHASLWGRIRQGRQFSIQWGADLAAAWLAAFSPVRRVDITANGTTTAYLVEGFSLEIDQRSAALGGMGLELGIVGGGGAITPPAVQISRDVRAVAGGIRITATGGARIP